MGGGDLNSKKSWHPNTMKNQERVWKAEQAAAEEQKRISELQRERGEERDRAELNQMVQRNAGSFGDNRLNWMYDKPDKKVQEEDYLLGKSIDQHYGRAEKDEQSSIPAVARRVVGSSMLASGGDTQVDLARKMREDPLLLVKERERAARAALLNNPLQRRRLADLLRKEQEQRKEKSKKKTKSKVTDLDNVLTAKLNALSGGKGIDIAKLLDDSSSDSSDLSDKTQKKKKKKKTKEEKRKKKAKKSKSKKKSHSSPDTSDSSDEPKDTKKKLKSNKTCLDINDFNLNSESRKRRSESDFVYEKTTNQHSEKKKSYETYTDRKRSRRYSSEERIDTKALDNRKQEKSREDKREAASSRYNERYHDRDRRSHRSPDYRNRSQSKKGLSEDEKAAKLAAMVAAGAEREEQRGRRVAAQRRADADDAGRGGRACGREARALPDSLESRIRSNRHYIQRDRQHMNEHFARR